MGKKDSNPPGTSDPSNQDQEHYQRMKGAGLYFLVVLAAFALFLTTKAGPRAKTARTMAQLRAFYAATTNFNAQFGRFPTNEFELVTNAANKAFIPPPPWRDGWGHPLVFTPYATNVGYGRIISYGRDGQPEGRGPNADIEYRFQ